MTSLRQIEANRRNARLSTGPVTAEGKNKSRGNAVRHGLTAETVIEALEDAEDYAAFEMAVTADYDAQSAVERELVLRLASVLWRLRRATAIEAGLFKQQARQLLKIRRSNQSHCAREEIIDSMYRNAIRAEGDVGLDQQVSGLSAGSTSTEGPDGGPDDLTCAFVRLSNLPSYPLDRLARYEAALWRQACQILFTLQCLSRHKPWSRLRFR